MEANLKLLLLLISAVFAVRHAAAAEASTNPSPESRQARFQPGLLTNGGFEGTYTHPRLNARV